MVNGKTVAIFFFLTLGALFANTNYQFHPIAHDVFVWGEGVYTNALGTNGVGVLLKHGEMPFANRRVRFTSLSTNVLVFAGGSNRVVVLSDQSNGIASPLFSIVGEGEAKVLVEALSRPGINPSYIDYQFPVTVRAYSLRNWALHIAFIFLLVFTVSMFLLSHFKRLRGDSERPRVSLVGMATLFGFSIAGARSFTMLLFFFIEAVLLFGIFYLQTNPLVGIFLTLFALTAYTIRNDRGYAFFFLFFALLAFAVYFCARIPLAHPLVTLGYMPRILLELWFILPFFFLVTIFFNSNYFPYFLLVIYSTLTGTGLVYVLVSIMGILLANIGFLLKARYGVNLIILYRMNFLKLKE